MRNAFAEEVTRLAGSDKRIVLLSGDIGNRLFNPLKEIAPDRMINCGIAEQNMMSVAAGLALNGYRPIVYTITPFATYRCFEQIRVGVCYHEVPVTIVGTGSGMSYTSLGPTHHSMEDVAVLRALPGMNVFCPADPMQVRGGLRAILQQDGPAYMRIGKRGEPSIHEDVPEIVIGKAITMRSGRDVCLIGTGVMMPLVLDTAEQLESAGISVQVENFHTVKPLDEERLEDVTGRYRLLAVVEEHGKIGGLYGAIAEWQARRTGAKARILSFGSDDRFLYEVGTTDFARKQYGIDVDSMVSGIRSAWAEGQ